MAGNPAVSAAADRARIPEVRQWKGHGVNGAAGADARRAGFCYPVSGDHPGAAEMADAAVCEMQT
jgi:hypothetical protein